MRFIFDLAYLLLLLCAAPWLLYSAVRHGKYREGFGQKLFGLVPIRARTEDRPPRTCVWLHAVSVGEVNLLEPVMRQLRQARPDLEIVVSTTTRTGMQLARRRFVDHHVFYCPLDFSWAVSRALSRLSPDLLVLAELELWPNLIRTAGRHGVPVAVVNGRLSDRSFRGYRRIAPIVGPTIRAISLLAVQNERYAERFRMLGADPGRIEVTGSIKFDGAQTERTNPATRQLRQLWRLTDEDRVLLAGSTQEPEETLVLETFAQLLRHHPEWRLIVVPRHPERFEQVAARIADSGLAWQRRSELTGKANEPTAKVLLVDAVGELGAWWGVAHVGFVGGSLGQRGGQNMIEPAAYGVAVCFGPNTWNFRQTVETLLSRDAAQVVRDGPELTRFVLNCAERPEQVHQLGEAARQVVREQQGATRRTVDLLLPLLPDNGSSHNRESWSTDSARGE